MLALYTTLAGIVSAEASYPLWGSAYRGTESGAIECIVVMYTESGATVSFNITPHVDFIQTLEISASFCAREAIIHTCGKYMNIIYVYQVVHS